jgi:hypothetical protein
LFNECGCMHCFWLFFGHSVGIFCSISGHRVFSLFSLSKNLMIRR